MEYVVLIVALLMLAAIVKLQYGRAQVDAWSQLGGDDEDGF
jgi:hypothetical protein